MIHNSFDDMSHSGEKLMTNLCSNTTGEKGTDISTILMVPIVGILLQLKIRFT